MSPMVYTQFVRKFEAQHEVTVFFNLRQVSFPTVSNLSFSIIAIG